MIELAQGQIWIADLPPPIHRRPVLILTRTNALHHLSNVTIATISRKVRGVETEVVLSADDGVVETCAVSLDNIWTIPRQYLDGFVTQVGVEKMYEVFAAVHAAFALPY